MTITTVFVVIAINHSHSNDEYDRIRHSLAILTPMNDCVLSLEPPELVKFLKSQLATQFTIARAYTADF